MNPRAEREIALLRAEILDLEDQYYSLKSRCESNGVSTDGDPVYYDSTLVDGECINCDSGTVIYGDAPGTSNNSNSLDGLESIDSVIEEPTTGSNPANSDSSGSRLRFVPHTDEKLSSQNVSYVRGNSKPQISDGNIASVSINRRISKGEDLDGIPGDEGLTLLIQPKDRSGKVTKQPGHITVQVIEPLSANNERQIGLWQFTPEESTSFFVKDELAQQGILLHLPWDGLVPKGNRLNVLVRFTVGNQQTVESTTQIGIVAPPIGYSSEDPLVAGWIERDPRWQDFTDGNFDDVEIAINNKPSENGDPQFRVKVPKAERRTSAPGWRPVR